ncbi:MAG TPA: hypothetical protein VFM37_04800 [Pseudonocardiaceae bacterium]|nr:hypothetical protein [Pseudonocardiaceae bacterium]
MRLPPVPGITPVSLGSVEHTAAELLAALHRIKGRDAARDPALAIAASQTAELAHERGAGLVATIEHPGADPALLVAWVLPLDRRLDPDSATDLGHHLADAGGPDIREVTRAQTAAGYPAVIAERIPPDLVGAQLQVLVFDVAQPRVAVFTLHSTTGRGWLEISALAGRFVSGLRFSGAESRSATARRRSGTPARSAPR